MTLTSEIDRVARYSKHGSNLGGIEILPIEKTQEFSIILRQLAELTGHVNYIPRWICIDEAKVAQFDNLKLTALTTAGTVDFVAGDSIRSRQ